MVNMVLVLGWPLDSILNIFYNLNNSVILRMNSTTNPRCPHSVISPAHYGFPWNNQHCPRQSPCLLHTWRVTLARVPWNQAPSWCSTCVYPFLALRVTSLLTSVSHKTQVLLHLEHRWSLHGFSECFSELGSVRDWERFVSRCALVPGQVHGQC